MPGQKRRFFKVFHQFVPLPSCVRVFAHYYPVSAAALPPPTVQTLGDIVSVFQYTATVEEAAALLSSMCEYGKNKAFLSLPHNPAFTWGQLSLF